MSSPRARVASGAVCISALFGAMQPVGALGADVVEASATAAIVGGAKDTREGGDSVRTTAPAVKIWVDADSTARWGVTEWFSLPAPGDSTPNGNASRGAFRYLDRACSTIDAVASVRGEASTRLSSTVRGPWRLLRDSTVGARFDLRYAVQRTGDVVDVPLVVPDRPIPKGDGDRSGSIEVVVRLRGVRGAITFPRLAASDDGSEWRGRFVAVPSFVRIRLDGATGACASASPSGDDGGLTWRFWLLVGILVAWVPAYQWWAQRQAEGDS